MHTVRAGGGGIVVCDIFLQEGVPCVTVCDRGEGVKFGQKSDIFF